MKMKVFIFYQMSRGTKTKRILYFKGGISIFLQGLKLEFTHMTGMKNNNNPYNN